jgi:hypothetical protein
MSDVRIVTIDMIKEVSKKHSFIVPKETVYVVALNVCAGGGDGCPCIMDACLVLLVT